MYDLYILKKAKVPGGVAYGFFRFRDKVIARKVIPNLHNTTRFGSVCQVEWATTRGVPRPRPVDSQFRRGAIARRIQERRQRVLFNRSVEDLDKVGAAKKGVEKTLGKVRFEEKVLFGGLPISGSASHGIIFGSLVPDILEEMLEQPEATRFKMGEAVERKRKGVLVEEGDVVTLAAERYEGREAGCSYPALPYPLPPESVPDNFVLEFYSGRRMGLSKAVQWGSKGRS